MKPHRFIALAASIGVCLLWSSPLTAAKKKTAAKSEIAKEILAIEFLGTVDCYWYPKAQTVLIDALEQNPEETVRFAAVQAITQQLQRGRGPLDPTLGVRFPDDQVLQQILRVARLTRPLNEAEVIAEYAKREPRLSRKDARRGDSHRSCCTDAVRDALARVAYGVNENACYFEPSARIRWRAERALSLCCDAVSTASAFAPMVPPEPRTDESGDETPPTDFPEADLTPVNDAPAVLGFRASGSSIPQLGRADVTNRFNIFDNMNAQPRSRVWFGYQLVKTQNNALVFSNQNEQLFDLLNTSTGRATFIHITGFGHPHANGPVVHPDDPDAADILRDLYLEANTGRDSRFVQFLDTHLYRFGFEHAITPDFSVGMVGQYVQPIDDVGQPELFANPQVMVKHVVFRSEETTLSAQLGVAPQISKPDFAIAEDTTRINPGMLAYHQLSERLFVQGAAGTSFPTEGNNVTTFDYALGLGWWAYRHESMKPWYRGEAPDKLILGFIPQFEVLGKHVLGDTTMLAPFSLSGDAPMTQDLYFAPRDGSRNIYLPGEDTPINEAPIEFEEPRHIIDLTAGFTLLLKHDMQLSAGVSFPVTGGTARDVEFLSTLNIGY